MNRVLVPFDFSPHSRRALALAMQGFPFGTDATIELLHVVDDKLYESALARDSIPSDAAITSYLDDAVTRIRAELATARGAAVADELLTPEQLVVHGRPHVQIEARLREPEVVGALLGGQGHGGATERLLGRTAQRVIRHAEVPIYVVKQPRTLHGTTRLLTAVDWSETSGRALALAARLASQADGLLSVLHVIDSPYVPYVQAFAHETDARNALEPLRERELERLVRFVDDTVAASERPSSLTQAVLFGDPATTIASQAQTVLAELVVVGIRGTSKLSRLLLGSTAEKLVTLSPCDILVVS